MKKYLWFGAMILTSMVVMYGIMYLNTYKWNHVFFSETRAYMTLIMGGAMSIVMLGFMIKMYKKRLTNILIVAGSIIIIGLALFLVRSQVTVGDVSYMRAMIPHHSIAILTSSRAKIEDPRVRELADEIIESQQREIEEMKILIEDIENKK